MKVVQISYGVTQKWAMRGQVLLCELSKLTLLPFFLNRGLIELLKRSSELLVSVFLEAPGTRGQRKDCWPRSEAVASVDDLSLLPKLCKQAKVMKSRVHVHS